jgi:hypothetical protein
MILGLEIALAVYGLFGLVGGTLIVSKSRVVQGYRARLLGLLALVPVVAAFVLIFTVSKENTQTLIEGIIVGVVAVLVFVLGVLLSVNPDAARQPTEEEDADQMVDYDESAAADEAAEPDIELTDGEQPVSTGPESEHLDYFDRIAEHLEYFDMNPEHLDYFDKKTKDANSNCDPLEEGGRTSAQPERKPPRPENRTSFQ